MQYRPLGRTGVEVSTISSGGMQFPRLEQDVVTALLHRAIELGVNLVETSPRYGDSEDKIGVALRDGWRRKVALSTKASYKVAPNADELKKAVESSLKRLQTDHLELYHLWFVNDWETFEKLTVPGGTLDAIRGLRDEGVIDHVGVTSHAKTDEIIRMIETGWFESVTIYHNAFKRKDEAVLEVAERLEMGVIAMGPLNGGLLGTDHEKMAFLRAGLETSNAQGALRWLIGDPRVTTAIVGFDSVAHVEDAVPVSDMPPMSDSQRRAIAERMDELQGRADSFCTSCGYCQPCPQGVKIPAILCRLARCRVYGSLAFERDGYAHMKEGRADACTECDECLEKCPQKLNIIEELKAAHKLLSP
jgi:predicted aldo/keto reductase-like oxidoreductase